MYTFQARSRSAPASTGTGPQRAAPARAQPPTAVCGVEAAGGLFAVDLSSLGMRGLPIQRKALVGAPDDPLEHEADAVADRIMRMPTPAGVEPVSLRSCPSCANRGRQRIYAKHTAAGEGEHVLDLGTASPDVMRGGLPLSKELRQYFEPRFGRDFSQVRVHTDSAAANAAREIQAKAYSLGPDIVFAKGAHEPGTVEGRRLLAHELAHVVQQSFEERPVIRRQPAKDENARREELLTAFTDGAGLPEKRVAQIKSAMHAFSVKQLEAMRKAGVRFWNPDSLPPEFAGRVKAKELTTPGGYLDVLHVIRMADKASTDAIRHELAHAWDHVRTGKVKPIGQLKGAAFEKALKQTPELSSATGEKRTTKEERGGSMHVTRLTIAEMLARYRKWTLREQSFDNPSTLDGYSKKSPREFYAEGYSVFHGGSEWNQARLLYYAPELYELLEAEAKEQGLAIPDRAALAQAIKEQRLPP